MLSQTVKLNFIKVKIRSLLDTEPHVFTQLPTPGSPPSAGTICESRALDPQTAGQMTSPGDWEQSSLGLRCRPVQVFPLRALVS